LIILLSGISLAGFYLVSMLFNFAGFAAFLLRELQLNLNNLNDPVSESDSVGDDPRSQRPSFITVSLNPNCPNSRPCDFQLLYPPCSLEWRCEISDSETRTDEIDLDCQAVP